MLASRISSRRVLCVLLCLTVVSALPAQTAPPATQKNPRASRLIKKPPPVIKSKKARTKKPAGPERPLEGSVVSGLICRLTKEPNREWYVVHFEDQEAGKGKEDKENKENKKPQLPRRVLPCAVLAEMEAISEKNPKVRFRIWAENTNYRGRAYILPQVVAMIRPAKIPTTTNAAATTKPTTSTKPATTAPTTSPTTSSKPAEPANQTRPSSTQPTTASAEAEIAAADPIDIEEVVKELLREDSEQQIIVPPAYERLVDKQEGESVAPNVRKPLPAGPGEMAADRQVRIVSRAGGWMEVRFKADNTLQEPPMRLLPCRMLEVAETLGRRSRTLRISGQIMRYKGRRYLLLRKVLRQRDLNRF